MVSYQGIISLVQTDLAVLDQMLDKLLKENQNDLTFKLEKYLFSKSKRIRSVLIFLLARAISGVVSDSEYKVSTATELVHNASLIHDDIIDDADIRRGEMTINNQFNNELAVVAGDFLLSLALDELLLINNPKVVKIFVNSLRSLCEGEISQYFSKNKVLTIEEYLSKSEKKTAMLFKAALLGVDALNKSLNTEKISEFALNFGLAFQVRDDLLNVLSLDQTKPLYSDIKNGIYTAPVIYYLDENKPDVVDLETFLKNLENSTAIAKTRELIQKHVDLAIASLDFLEDNLYKEAIIELCEYLSEVD